MRINGRRPADLVGSGAGNRRLRPVGTGVRAGRSPAPRPEYAELSSERRRHANLQPDSGDPDDAQIPTRAAGTFTTATGKGRVIGKGKKRVRYSVSVEKGIAWGDIPAWKPDRFAASIEQVLAAPNGWSTSAQHPVTNDAVNLTRASWSFQRVGTSTVDVDVRLATPRTVDHSAARAASTPRASTPASTARPS